tara:strand:+ start:342 stop:1085 length:744 start_codon:yes stop_codon:yes gene_type:complete
MAYNNLSGTVVLPDRLVTQDLTLHENSILSGNLSTSDGASIINIPRVSNATNNAILTNVDGDANQLFCESNLMFNGSALAITGQVSASLNISASYFYGNGSKLTGISGSGGGSPAFGPTGSLQFQTGSGGLSGSADLVFSGSVLKINGGLKLNRRLISSTVTASVNDYFIGLNSSGGSFEIRLLAAANLASGQMLVVKDENGNLNSNNVIIRASGSQTIDGQNSLVLESSNASVQLYCDGVSKYFIF